MSTMPDRPEPLVLAEPDLASPLFGAATAFEVDSPLLPAPRQMAPDSLFDHLSGEQRGQIAEALERLLDVHSPANEIRRISPEAVRRITAMSLEALAKAAQRGGFLADVHHQRRALENLRQRITIRKEELGAIYEEILRMQKIVKRLAQSHSELSILPFEPVDQVRLSEVAEKARTDIRILATRANWLLDHLISMVTEFADLQCRCEALESAWVEKARRLEEAEESAQSPDPADAGSGMIYKRSGDVATLSRSS